MSHPCNLAFEMQDCTTAEETRCLSPSPAQLVQRQTKRRVPGTHHRFRVAVAQLAAEDS